MERPLLLVSWITRAQHERLLAGESVATADAEPARLAAFCARNQIPWSPQSAAISCFAGRVPLAVAARHRGLVRLELDVDWILGDVRLVVDGAFEPFALALADRQDRGEDVWRALRRVQVLGGAPADRGAALVRLARGYVGSFAVEARLLRPLDIDDVDRWEHEAGLTILAEA